MGQQKEGIDVVAAEPSAGGGGGVSLGKGAWDCDNNVEIPAETEVRFVRSTLVANISRLSMCSCWYTFRLTWCSNVTPERG